MDTPKVSKRNPCYLEAQRIEVREEILLTKFKMPSSPEAVPPFNTARFSIVCDGKTSLDQHSEKEMWFIIRGSGILNYKGESTEIAAGDAVYFESNAPHQLSNNGSIPIEVFSIWWGE